MKKLSIILALSMAFVLMMSGTVAAEEEESGISNILRGTFDVDVTDTVSTEDELRKAIEEEDSITLDNDITVEDNILVIDESLTIDGDGNTLEFEVDTGSQEGLVTVDADNIKLEDLTIDSNLEKGDYSFPILIQEDAQEFIMHDVDVDRDGGSTYAAVKTEYDGGNNDGLTIEDSNITGGPIALYGDHDDVTIEDVEVRDVGDEGIWTFDRIEDLTLSRVTVEDYGDDSQAIKFMKEHEKVNSHDNLREARQELIDSDASDIDDISFEFEDYKVELVWDNEEHLKEFDVVDAHDDMDIEFDVKAGRLGNIGEIELKHEWEHEEYEHDTQVTADADDPKPELNFDPVTIGEDGKYEHTKEKEIEFGEAGEYELEIWAEKAE
ncbi:pectate lyase-like adhesive domain-containing protein [Natranaerobius trueperi]|uniref:Uncharacterized protein n=1 Tax=Natranaerobius trueperi TaxID=759412 RepID=A0A226BWG8_9FIRM|nr:pectate lyase-like adhesive domain-containing protein [Natranaerobius trueperi]OWZ83388.1 hypothetical protein CDO51_08785 [Natranaerobius trueperi]